ncbi:hypothetical protein PanWU01x14_147390, partial [Parasponia andersonii]
PDVQVEEEYQARSSLPDQVQSPQISACASLQKSARGTAWGRRLDGPRTRSAGAGLPLVSCLIYVHCRTPRF